MNAAAPARVLVTRPAAQAEGWVARLRAAGIEAEALPLIAIVASDNAAALGAAWASLASRRLVVFVSANAVLHFFAARPSAVVWPDGLQAAAPGPGTAEALADVGLPAGAVVAPAADAPQFDSEALWLRLETRDWRDASVLFVSGDGGRVWLADRLRERGAEVEAVSAYRRVAPTWSDADREHLERALADRASLWLFSSAEAVANLEQAAGAGRLAGARAVATHRRIAERARGAGFGRVVEAAPRLDALVACIQSIGP